MNTPVHIDLQRSAASFGLDGSDFYSGTASPAGKRYYALKCLMATTFTALACKSDPSALLNTELPAGTEIIGVGLITGFTLSGGLVQGFTLGGDEG
jgi:hypothetical protein